MKTSTRAFVESIRRGKSFDDALTDYCWANLILPVLKEDWIKSGGDPSKCQDASEYMWRLHGAVEAALNEKSDDEKLAAAFEAGLKAERDSEYHPIVWRVLTKGERPATGQLLRAMSESERDTAMKLFGVEFVARHFVTA